jgi:hypothetical protein
MNVFEVVLTLRAVPNILKLLFPFIARMIPG